MSRILDTVHPGTRVPGAPGALGAPGGSGTGLVQTLAAIDQSGLRGFLGKRIMTELERVELAPLADGRRVAHRVRDQLGGAGRGRLRLDESLKNSHRVTETQRTTNILCTP